MLHSNVKEYEALELDAFEACNKLTLSSASSDGAVGFPSTDNFSVALLEDVFCSSNHSFHFAGASSPLRNLFFMSFWYSCSIVYPTFWELVDIFCAEPVEMEVETLGLLIWFTCQNVCTIDLCWALKHKVHISNTHKNSLPSLSDGHVHFYILCLQTNQITNAYFSSYIAYECCCWHSTVSCNQQSHSSLTLEKILTNKKEH